MERRGFLGLITKALGLGFVASAFPGILVGKNRKLKKTMFKSEICWYIFVRKGSSWTSISELYTGTKKYAGYLSEFNGGPLLAGKYVFVPRKIIEKKLVEALKGKYYAKIPVKGRNLTEIVTKYCGMDPWIIRVVAAVSCLTHPKMLVYKDDPIFIPDIFIKKNVKPLKKLENKKQNLNTHKGTKFQSPFGEKKLPLKHKCNSWRDFEKEIYSSQICPSEKYGAHRGKGGKRKHEGLDLWCKEGTKLYPLFEGKVTKVVNRDKGVNGKLVKVLSSNSQYYFIYIHLKEVYVKKGQKVSLNTFVGSCGTTGNAYKKGNKKYSPHVHIVVREKKGFWKLVDPYRLIFD